MSVNAKKNIRLVNRTKYFDPEKDRTHVVFASPLSWQSRKLKIESFEARLYWQYRYCLSRGCSTYYYTLTYSDENVPFIYGGNCFDYYDLRDFLTGGFRKQLLRKYGLTFKYFIGAELGDGKGKRGLANNPHYHILFFLEPAENVDFPFSLISPNEFRHLVRIYWQGFDQDEGFKDYRTSCRYGIATEGENLGVVNGFRALSYCAKYVTKDVSLKMREVRVLKSLRLKYFYELQHDLDFHKSFFADVIKPLYFFSSKVEDSQVFVDLLSNQSSFYERLPGVDPFSMFGSEETFVTDVRLICRYNNLWKFYYDYLNKIVDNKVKDDLNEWRNRFCNKPRISQGVGLYALNFIEDVTNPMIEIPTKNGKKMRRLPLYLYRKLFMGKVKPIEPTYFAGKFIQYPSVLVLNRAGIDYKVSMLDERIEKLIKKVKSQFELLDPYLFDLMCASDVNTDVSFSYEYLLQNVSFHINEMDDVYRKYAVYKLVYEDRCFRFDGSFPVLDFKKDFIRFLQPSVFSVPRSDLRLDAFIDDMENDRLDFMYYYEHPDFHSLIFLFRVFDLVIDYFFIQRDNSSQDEQKRRDDVRRYHISNLMFNFKM